MPKNSNLQILPSTCPHDCPSTCALDVERLDALPLGKVPRPAANSYTAGVIFHYVSPYAARRPSPAPP